MPPAIDYLDSSTSDGLFNRLGKIVGLINSMNTYQTGTLDPKVDALALLFAAGDPEIYRVVNAADSIRTSQTAVAQRLQLLAQRTLIDTVNEDQLQPDRSLATALRYLIRSMETDTESVARVTTSVTVTANAGNVGNPQVIATANQASGLAAPYVYPETIFLETIADGQAGSGGVAGAETVRLRGQQSLVSPLDAGWPGGSGAGTSLRVIDATTGTTSGYGQALANGGFTNWTDGVPDYWVVSGGTLGSIFFEESSSGLGSTPAIAITGDGSSQVTIRQTFGDSAAGTPVALAPLRQFAWCLWLRVSFASTGTIRVALVDSGGNVINDDQTTPNSSSRNINTLSAGVWTPFTGIFRTPTTYTGSLRFEIKMTTPLQSGRVLYIDRAMLSLMQPLYVGGPSFAIFRGTTDTILEDRWEAAVTNSATSTSWHQAMDRLFGMRQLGLVLPESNSPTILSSLIS